MQVDGHTELYGIMGDPVAHSLSPAMHNGAFAHLGMNRVYVPFPVKDVPAAMNGFRALGVKGVSVTIPHKQAVIDNLDEIDPVAEKIGAVNTLQINDGRIKGFNTDWLGANRALEQQLSLAGKKVLLLGAGGSARAIGFGLLEAGAEVLIASRTPSSGEALAATLNCPWHPIAEAGTISADALVNATSVGMGDLADKSPIGAEALRNFPVVMDIVYAPLETKLLREAKAAGCKTVDGLAMLLLQGAAQFELWTGVDAPVDVMRERLLAGLASR
ncbi:MAG: shikimate dehydrogenase [Desulfobulbaceae bacterium]|nr:shikimate dehydrogenase [Desulfobulbaceae bacterium]